MAYSSPGVNRPQWICCPDNHSIIVTSPRQSKVCKFPLLQAEPEAEWICDTLVLPTGVCADHLGLIYVCNVAKGSQQITVLSPQGKSLFWLDEWRKIAQNRWMIIRAEADLYKLGLTKKRLAVYPVFFPLFHFNWKRTNLVSFYISSHFMLLFCYTLYEYKSPISIQRTTHRSNLASGNSSR